MTNDEYSAAIVSSVNELQELRNQAVSLAKGVIGETLLSEDLYFCASLDRCIRLIDGFIPLLQSRNLTCAGVLLRMQMDNCMRTYAAFIAKDKDLLFRSLLDGSRIDKLKDKEGHKFSDGYLKGQVDKIDPGFEKVYDQACGFVHLSSKAFYQTVGECKDGKFGFLIGLPLPEKRNEPLLECAHAYIHYVKLFFKLIQAVVDSKQRYDSQGDSHESGS